MLACGNVVPALDRDAEELDHESRVGVRDDEQSLAHADDLECQLFVELAAGCLRRTLAGVAAMLFLVSVPLAVGSGNVLLKHYLAGQVQDVADDWASEEDWIVTDVSVSNNFGDYTVSVRALGQPPQADKQALRRKLDAAGLEAVDVEMTLLFGGQVNLTPDSSDTDG